MDHINFLKNPYSRPIERHYKLLRKNLFSKKVTAVFLDFLTKKWSFCSLLLNLLSLEDCLPSEILVEEDVWIFRLYYMK